jgi:hypothetical protein
MDYEPRCCANCRHAEAEKITSWGAGEAQSQSCWRHRFPGEVEPERITPPPHGFFDEELQRWLAGKDCFAQSG